MGDYFIKYLTSIAFLFIFSTCVLRAHLVVQKNHLTEKNNHAQIVECMVSACLCNLFLSFYVAAYFTCSYFHQQFIRYTTNQVVSTTGSSITSSLRQKSKRQHWTGKRPKKNTQAERQTCYVKVLNLPSVGSEPEAPVVKPKRQNQEKEEEEEEEEMREQSYNHFYAKSLKLWFHVYIFVFSVFCLTYSINMSNTNASFFLCIGTTLCTLTQSSSLFCVGCKHHILGHQCNSNDYDNLQSEYFNSKLRVVHFLIAIIFLCSFSFWIYSFIQIPLLFQQSFLYYPPPPSGPPEIMINLNKTMIPGLLAHSNDSNITVVTGMNQNSSSSSIQTAAQNETLKKEEDDNKTIILLQNQFWRNLWFEILGPLLTPFYIHSFKSKVHPFHKDFSIIISASKGQAEQRTEDYGGDVYVYFTLPFLAMISMIFMSLYFNLMPTETAEHVFMGEFSMSMRNDDTNIWMEWTIFFVFKCIAMPCFLFLSLIIYIGAMGKRGYSLICATSLNLVFFIVCHINIQKSFNSPDPVHHHDHDDFLVPCVVMSVISYLLSILSLMIHVYWKEIMPISPDTPSSV